MNDNAPICPFTRMPCIGEKCIALIAKVKWVNDMCTFATYCTALKLFINLDKDGNVISREEDKK